MPKVLEINGFIFYFFSADCAERTHVHIKKGSAFGKIWLRPEIKVFYLKGFKKQETRQILKLVQENSDYLIKEWDAYCNN